jgi:hypothetical protein
VYPAFPLSLAVSAVKTMNAEMGNTINKKYFFMKCAGWIWFPEWFAAEG